MSREQKNESEERLKSIKKEEACQSGIRGFLT